MTIEEYLRKRIEEETKIFLTTDRPETGLIYFKGVIDGLKEILSKLPSFEHDVTLREAKDFCQKQLDDCEDDEDPCEYCPMAMECSDSDDCRWMECGEIADILPRDWDIDAIEKRVKEARND